MRRTVLLLYVPLLMSGLIGACAGSRSALKQPEPTPAVRPADPEALSHFIDAKLAQMRGDRVAAIRHLRIATKEDSLSATLQRALAENLVALKQYAQAVGPSQAAVRIAPGVISHHAGCCSRPCSTGSRIRRRPNPSSHRSPGWAVTTWKPSGESAGPISRPCRTRHLQWSRWSE